MVNSSSYLVSYSCCEYNTDKIGEKDVLVLGFSRSQARLRLLHTLQAGSLFILILSAARCTSLGENYNARNFEIHITWDK